MRLLRRLMLVFRRPSPAAHTRPIDPEMAAARQKLSSVESRLASKLHVSVEQLRADYERGDGALGRH